MTAPTKAPEETRDEADIEAESMITMSDGRVFRISEGTTSRQDMWVMSRLDKAGLEKIAATYNTPEHLDEMAQKLVFAAYENGTLYEILAGLLVEDGKKWTIENAKANAEYFANLTNSADKQALQGPIVSILMLYFASGLVSNMTSLKSMETEESPTSPVASSESPSSAIRSPASSFPTVSNVPVPENVLAHLHAAQSTLVTTTPSPEKSQDSTMTDSK